MLLKFRKILIILITFQIFIGISCREYFSEGNAINDINYLQDMVIAFVSPGSGPSDGGTEVTIQGIGFNSNTQVFFGNRNALVKKVTNDQLKVVLPSIQLDSLWTLVNVAVKNNISGSSDTARNAFRYYNSKIDTLYITRINPTLGPNEGGITVKISGFGFRPDTKVFFGELDVAEITSVSPFELKVIAPSTTGNNSNLNDALVDVKVLNSLSGKQYVLHNAFQYGVTP
ncbi:MAG TPA: IPT/TIG domain-containing protein [Ignavibacteriaceae bacterium]|nr:IPT/TIG domain-containing protein [Ignavibacteriaceae bacterium]